MEEQASNENEHHLNKIKELVKKELERFSNIELTGDELDVLYKLVDINKDLENIDYWNVKKEVMKMRYNGGYGDYSEGGYSGNYGRRGVPGTGRGRYRGGYSAGGYSGAGESLNEAQEHYGAYSEGKEAMNMGNYGAEGTTIKALDYMLQSVCQFMEMLQSEATSQEEMQMIEKYARKIGEM